MPKWGKDTPSKVERSPLVTNIKSVSNERQNYRALLLLSPSYFKEAVIDKSFKKTSSSRFLIKLSRQKSRATHRAFSESLLELFWLLQSSSSVPTWSAWSSDIACKSKFNHLSSTHELLVKHILANLKALDLSFLFECAYLFLVIALRNEDLANKLRHVLPVKDRLLSWIDSLTEITFL